MSIEQDTNYVKKVILNELYEYINYHIVDEVEIIRMRFRMQKNYSEIKSFLENKINKLKKKVEKFDKRIYTYFPAFINYIEHFNDNEKHEIKYYETFFDDYFEDMFELLAKHNLKEIDGKILDIYEIFDLLEKEGFDVKLIKLYAKGVALVKDLELHITFYLYARNEKFISNEEATHNLNNAFIKLNHFLDTKNSKYIPFDFNEAFSQYISTLIHDKKNKNEYITRAYRLRDYLKTIDDIFQKLLEGNCSNHQNLDNIYFLADIKALKNLPTIYYLKFYNNLFDYKSGEITPTIPYLSTILNINQTTISNAFKSESELKYNFRIFTSQQASLLFSELVNRYKESPNHLAEISFVYHKMSRDSFIQPYCMQIEIFNYIGKFDIHINKFKRLSEIGNISSKQRSYDDLKAQYF